MTDPPAAPTSDRAAPKPNRLAREKSPYLLQHRLNPVDWYPWCDEAFERASREDRPVLLSIGYATCHWCHVMERESFEDEQVARLLNEVFVCVKVDREERPDIDEIYMRVCQMMTGGGGWPLTILMTPDKRPFFAATYIPKHRRFGRIGLMELIPGVQTLWRERRPDVLSSAGQIVDHLRATEAPRRAGEVGASLLDAAFSQLRERYDSTCGGFGPAPKFPSPHVLMFLLRYWSRSGSEPALAMAEHQLRSMRAGGIFDHVGLGFHRYATDRGWLVPHFEKMLYDQALLGLAYSEAFRATGRDHHARTAREIFTYVLRDLTSPSGAFYCAEDADSEGEEGLFYLWTTEELAGALGEDDAELAAAAFNATVEGNYQEEAGGGRTGHNILHLRDGLEATAERLGMTVADLDSRLDSVRRRLLEVRATRPRPLLDDKILADWNGLMAASLAAASRLLDQPELADAAGRAVDFVLATMRDDQGRLHHRYRDGDLALAGMLDDHAFMALALVELYQATLDVRRLEQALDLVDTIVELFWDSEDGGLFMTAADAEELLIRPKELHDGALPSGSSAALVAVVRLARLTGRRDLADRAEALLEAAAAEISRGPAGHAFLLCGLDLHLGPSQEIVLVGDPLAEDTRALLDVIRADFLPRASVLLVPPGAEGDRVRRLAPFVSGHRALDGRATAYVCRDLSCDVPTTCRETLRRQIRR